MKCTYTFRISGKVKLSGCSRLEYKGWEYYFCKNSDNLVTEIKVVIPLGPNPDLPRFDLSSEIGKPHELYIPTDLFHIVRDCLRSLEGILSAFGVECIDFNCPSVEWVAESEEEDKHLPVKNYAIEFDDISSDQIPALPESVLLKSVIASTMRTPYEIALSFFRKGNNDHYYGRYIEAIYNFYFMIEHLYGEGKTKNKGVKKAFMGNLEFVSTVERAIQDLPRRVMIDPILKSKYVNLYEGKPASDVIDRIVMLRGYLHHHNSKRQDMWHPENHREYELDAVVMRTIAFEIAAKIIDATLNAKAVVDEYHQVTHRTRS